MLQYAIELEDARTHEPMGVKKGRIFKKSAGGIGPIHSKALDSAERAQTGLACKLFELSKKYFKYINRTLK